MLVISRRPGETVFIGEDIEVRVLGTDGNQIKLGFEAPKDMAILREEVKLRNAAADDDKRGRKDTGH